MREHIARRERDMVKAVSRRVCSIKKGKLERWVFELAADLTDQAADLRGRKRIIAAAFRCAEDAFGQALECRRLIDFSDLRTVHRTRVAFKKFRYIVESLPPEAAGWSKRELRRLAFYQRRMGTIQDLEVLDACISDFLERYEGNEDLLALFRAYLRRRQTRVLGAFRKSVDRLLEFWPPPAVAGCLQSPSRQFPA